MLHKITKMKENDDNRMSLWSASFDVQHLLVSCSFEVNVFSVGHFQMI